jgi:hypothetical protein
MVSGYVQSGNQWKTSVLNHGGYYSFRKTKGEYENNITKLKPLPKKINIMKR